MSSATLSVPHIVRWAPVALALGACLAESPTELARSSDPAAPSAAPRGNDRFRNGNANLGDFHVDEQRVWHARFFPGDGPFAGRYRICQQNPLEDSDGNDWRNGVGGSHHLVTNEKDAFVLVKEFEAGPGDFVTGADGSVRPKAVGTEIGLNDPRWAVTFLGRASFRMSAWLDSNESELSRQAWARGVVAPVRDRWADEVEAGFLGKGTSRGDDLFNVDLMPGSDAAGWVDDLLADTHATAPRSLRGIECEVRFTTFTGIITANEIDTDRARIPGGDLKRFVPGA